MARSTLKTFQTLRTIFKSGLTFDVANWPLDWNIYSIMSCDKSG